MTVSNLLSCKLERSSEFSHNGEPLFHTINVDIDVNCASTIEDEPTEKVPLHLLLDNHTSYDLITLASKCRTYAYISNKVEHVLSRKEKETHLKLRFIVPSRNGFILQPDIVSRRLVRCEYILETETEDFTSPRQFCQKPDYPVPPVGCEAPTQSDLLHALTSAVAACQVQLELDAPKCATKHTVSRPQCLDEELENRLSFPWLLDERSPGTRLCVIDWKGLFKADDYCRAAQGLGFELIILDEPETWSNHVQIIREEFPRLAITFVSIKMEGEGLADRIVKALQPFRDYLHGITTMNDPCRLAVATAAKQLNLPTEAPAAFELVLDKYRLRLGEGGNSADVRLENGFSIPSLEMDFPVIVKPRDGDLSRGVFKARDEGELTDALNNLHQDHSKSAIIEPYCDGPEVDVNVVLCNGEMIFAEVVDDFPSMGDAPSGPSDVFTETDVFYPSGLPNSEQELLKSYVFKMLLKYGMRNGVFHVEARVQNSASRYYTKNGLFDLHEQEEPRLPNGLHDPPSVFLIEVNPRPPGIYATRATSVLYGIDFYSIALALVSGNSSLARALSHPFLRGPQGWIDLRFISPAKGGILKSNDICEELRARRPDLMAQVPHSMCFFQKGDRVPEPDNVAGGTSWLAHFNCFSKKGRTHALGLTKEVVESVHYVLD